MRAESIRLGQTRVVAPFALKIITGNVIEFNPRRGSMPNRALTSTEYLLMRGSKDAHQCQAIIHFELRFTTQSTLKIY
jgi:hypothetical protein